MNRRERAIVTATPGTTRDLVTETMALGGIPIKLVDTAGIRHSTDEAESIGIRKSYEALSEADLVLVVLDTTRAISAADASAADRSAEDKSAEDKDLLEICRNGRGLAVANKADLAPDAELNIDGLKVFKTSAVTGEGIERLRGAILEHVSGPAASGERETGFLTNVRHQRLVEESLNCLDAACHAVTRHTPHEMIMLDLYGALRPLDAITGETTTDDILNLIFSSFCIGK